jgi:hypothetical protein
MDEVICPYDCRRTALGKLENYITDDELGALFSDIKAEGQYIIFESCLSGGMVDGGIFSADADGDGYINAIEAETFNEEMVREIDVGTGNFDADGYRRVVVVSTLDGTLGLASWLAGFPLTLSIAGSLKKGILGHAPTNNDGFITAEGSFKWARRLAFVLNSLKWIGIWSLFFVQFYEYEKIMGNDPDPMGVAYNATKMMFVQFVYTQIYMRILSGHFFLNWPHMIDKYYPILGKELPIVELGGIAEHQPASIPLISNEIWDEENEIEWDKIDPEHYPPIDARITHKVDGSTVKFKGEVQGPPEYTWQWDFGDGTTSAEQNPQHKYSNSATYYVELTVTDGLGRSKTVGENVKPKAKSKTFSLLPIWEMFPRLRELLLSFC